ncbi:YagK/YfjJ domain-containing protein [Aliarcobacter cryaerophilus]|uniref:YagK/YfjJ C-terminal domain-containing protein n=1 Tax=Aliarcobacter cryaerophilus TaxID=28198 RepID=A0A2S9SPX4_9BACT|nr:inovirus-type Gp2 protein [Aliarcobacter cryaerophilus]PRM88644.1 hypothetical protein CJ669_03160 [Aliarcobacter cryaerophilus]
MCSKTEKRRIASAKEYIDAQFENNSKLLVTRVDLGLKKEFAATVTPQEINKAFENLLDNRRSKPSIFKDNVGYIAKLEYTKSKGAHLHTIFLFDGNKVQKDAYKAKQIGDYWSNNITDGKGLYHNCNLNDYGDTHAIGMIEYSDTNKIDLLKNNVVSYLAKDEQDVKNAKAGNIVAFRRGLMPKKSDVKMGRPRKVK